MIQPMNKYAFLVFHRDYEGFLLRLRELGVVHVREQVSTKEVEELQALQAERMHLVALHKELRPYESPVAESGQQAQLPTEVDGRALVSHIEEELEARRRLVERITTLKAEADEVRPWGAFDEGTFTRLEEVGYTLDFYALPVSQFTESFRATHDVVPIEVVSGRQYFVLLRALDAKVHLPEAEAIRRPQRSVDRVEQELAEAQTALDQATDQLRASFPEWQAQLQAYDTDLENHLTFGTVRLQADRLADERLLLLEGFVPTDHAKAFEEELSKGGYYFKQVDFDPETERVPIQLKNNAFTKCFEFITGLFSLPNYQELDQTVLIAPFFMLFFGMCFGDAGYGLILFSVATFVRLKKRGEDNSIVGLIQWLGGGAFVVGLLMGGIFGIELPWAHNKDYLFNQDNLMTISVVIGLVQILLGKAVGAYKTGKQKGWKHSLAGYAWVLLLIAVGLIYALPMMQFTLPEPVTYILYGVAGLSVLVAFFYNSPGKNPFFNLGAGLWKSYETASGLLGDSLSYIRLFAIGLTGGILGSVFNQLAMSCLPASGSGASVGSYIVGWILALIILVFGHGINFGIAMIGAFVHPLRLTFVEYYKNSEFEGGGKPYTPFKRK